MRAKVFGLCVLSLLAGVALRQLTLPAPVPVAVRGDNEKFYVDLSVNHWVNARKLKKTALLEGRSPVVIELRTDTCVMFKTVSGFGFAPVFCFDRESKRVSDYFEFGE